MKKENSKKPDPEGKKSTMNENNLPGYPVYPESEDIYNNYLEEKDIDPEEILKMKKLNDEAEGDDLDIPGSELDDDMENIGSEDEENNYYSLGGDDHDDLEENQGE
jgi:hypothetical protein